MSSIPETTAGLLVLSGSWVVHLEIKAGKISLDNIPVHVCSLDLPGQ